MMRLCKKCGDRSKPLNPSATSDYHPACHPAKNKIAPRLGADFFSKVRSTEAKDKGLLEGGRIRNRDVTSTEPVGFVEVGVTPTNPSVSVARTVTRGPKPMSTSVRDLLKGSSGMLEKRAKALEKRAARIGAKVDRVWKKVEPLKKIQEDLLEAARKLRTIIDAD